MRAFVSAHKSERQAMGDHVTMHTPTPPVIAVLVALAALGALQDHVYGITNSKANRKKGFGDGGQEYGYVDVRPGAHMFYWLFYVNGGEVPADKPLVIWLQGGPGASSTSFGNFEEIGPLDSSLNKRNSSWVNYVNVMFVDNPVGTGFSYVDSRSQLTTNNKQIASDLVELMRGFLRRHPQFADTPVYVFSESYGGKMAAEFALSLYKERKAGKINVNIKGVALGDAWISPVDTVMSWADYLLQTGMVDSEGYKAVDQLAQQTKRAAARGMFAQATLLWSQTEQVISRAAQGVSFYNIMEKMPARTRRALRDAADATLAANHSDFLFRVMSERIAPDAHLDDLMNRRVKPALGVVPAHINFRTTSAPVFAALYADFMKPVTTVVERLLSETDLKVVVFNGQLDLIVSTPGTLAWAERLKWKSGEYWVSKAPRRALAVDGMLEGFVKSAGKFSFYWINRAGHMVPADNPAAAIEMLRQVTEYDKERKD